MMDVTCRRPISWASHAITHEGMVRKVNEDAVLNKPHVGLWAVADGMGGHKVGDIASAKIVEALDKVAEADRLSKAVDIIEDCLIDINQAMLEYAFENLNGHTMGSTVVCTIIKGRIGACVWVGDSRLFRFRNGQLTQISRDHSQVEEMIEMGLISPEEAEHHPNRNVITRAIGVENQLMVDVTLFSAQLGDTFLICSDGLYNAVNNENIAESLTLKSVSEAAQALLAKSLDNSARDNVSIIVIKGFPGKIHSTDTDL